jgi:hypothetical protein
MTYVPIQCCVWDIPTLLLLLLGVGVGLIWALAVVLDWITAHFHDAIVARFPGPLPARKDDTDALLHGD